MSFGTQFRSGGKLRYQEFLTSGTFTPSARLIAAGGQCMARLVGGGAGSAESSGNRIGGGGGAVRDVLLTITSAQTVTIGAGGTAPGGAGGATSIGSLASAVGGMATGHYPGLPGGGHGAYVAISIYTPGPGVDGLGTGGQSLDGVAALANSGHGGNADSTTHRNGASGRVAIWWFE